MLLEEEKNLSYIKPLNFSKIFFIIDNLRDPILKWKALIKYRRIEF